MLVQASRKLDVRRMTDVTKVVEPYGGAAGTGRRINTHLKGVQNRDANTLTLTASVCG